MLCSPPGVRGTPGTGGGHAWWVPCAPVNRPGIRWGPKYWWVGSSFHWDPFPSVDSQWAPSLLSPAPKRACHLPTTTMSVALREEKATLQEPPLQWGPLRPLMAPQEPLSFWWHSRGSLLSLSASLSSHFLWNLQTSHLTGSW